MTRYTVPAKDPAHQVDVGWDRPLTTFFAQVYRPAAASSDEDDDMLLWVGTSPAELRSVEALARALAGHADLPADIAAKLKADRLADIDRGPTRFQRDMLATFGLRR